MNRLKMLGSLALSQSHSTNILRPVYTMSYVTSMPDLTESLLLVVLGFSISTDDISGAVMATTLQMLPPSFALMLCRAEPLFYTPALCGAASS